jgi:hypothetical protein
MRQLRLFSLFFVILLPFNSSKGKDAFSISMIQTAAGVPSEVYSLGVQFSKDNFSEKFGQNGKVVSLADLMNRDFSYNDILDQERDPREKVKTKGALEAFGVQNFADVAGSHFGDINIDSEVRTVVLGYGLNDSLSFFLIQPIINLDIQFKNKFTKSASFNQLLDNIENDGNFNQVDEVESKIANPIAYQLEQFGYEPLYPSTINSLGDLRLMGRWNYFKSEDWIHTLSTTLVLPTGKENDVNQFFDLYIGDGQTDLELMSLHGYSFSKSFAAVFGVSYTRQFASTKKLRVPEKRRDVLTPDIDSNIRQKFGDMMGVLSQIDYNLSDSFTLSLGHNFKYKEADSYSGSAFDPVRYQYMEDDTEQNLQDLTLGIRFSSINLFLQNKFALPMNMELSYTKTISGKNTLESNLLALNIMGFYK